MNSLPSVPLLGHVTAYVRDPIGFITLCTETCGDWTPVRFGAMRAFVATHPDLIESVLVTNYRSFRKSPGLRRSSILFGQGLLTAEGDFWRKQRRLIQPAFHRNWIAAYAQTMLDLTQSHLSTWTTGNSFDLHADLMRLTMCIAVETLFGAQIKEVETVARALEVGQDAFARWMHYLIMFPDWIPTPRLAGIARTIQELDRVVYRIIAERRANRDSRDDRKDLLSMLLSLQDADDGTVMSERQLRDEILTLFLAGHETTALSLTWASMLIAQNPAVEQRLHCELDTVLNGRAASYSDVEHLVYTEQVIREAMRLYPPAWIIGRQAVEAVEIGGHVVPAGAVVIMPQYVVHRDPRFFPDPDSFIPDRWTQDFIRRLPKYAYFPFGGGPRVCIGSAFATIESVLLLASIASQFRLRLSPSHPIVLQPAFTLRPKHGIWITAERC